MWHVTDLIEIKSFVVELQNVENVHIYHNSWGQKFQIKHTWSAWVLYFKEELKPGLHIVVTVSEHACDDASKWI